MFFRSSIGFAMVLKSYLAMLFYFGSVLALLLSTRIVTHVFAKIKGGHAEDERVLGPVI